MPLIKSPSKMAFKKNVETEMKANPDPKDKARNLAIAYSMKRQAKKKMANGGSITANQEVRATADNADTKENMAQMKARHLSEMQELVANDESMHGDSIDGAMDNREMAMKDVKHKMAHGGELVANDESMASDSIDAAGDERNENMLDAKPRRHKDELLAKDMGMARASDRDAMELEMLSAKGQPDEYSKEGIINYADGGRVDQGPRIDADSEDEEEMRMLGLAKGGIADSIMRMRKKMYAKGGEVDAQANSNEDLNEEDQLSFDAARKKTYYDLSQLDGQPEDSNEMGDEREADAENEHDMVGKIRKKMKAKRLI